MILMALALGIILAQTKEAAPCSAALDANQAVRAAGAVGAVGDRGDAR
jgi:hypothetical protein